MDACWLERQQLKAPLVDPRLGDAEADASSTKHRSLFALAGSLLAEISLPKLIVSWIILIAVPALLLGFAPLVVSAWLTKFTRSLINVSGGALPLILLALVVAVGCLGSRLVRRGAEEAFWSLNSIAIQPMYLLLREGVRHFLERMLDRRLDERSRSRLRAVSAGITGGLMCALALLAISIVWPHSRWKGELSDLMVPLHLVVPTLANAVVILCGYCAAVALVWGAADAIMDQPRDFDEFALPAQLTRSWRIAHLSDLHIVGERFGFRIESGRAGPRGNGRVEELLARLAVIHQREPLDHILITGDITDAGRAPEWAEFFTMISAYPGLVDRMMLLPGNHDINVVDRSNPARLDLPLGPGRHLREIRALSGIAALQADKVHVVDMATGRLGDTLEQKLARHRGDIEAFADTGNIWLGSRLASLWVEATPMVLPPDQEDGLGFILLNSTAQTHFSFTNALGLISSEQAKAIHLTALQFPCAHWVVALHHHIIEYPAAAKTFSERIGTALINGSWFVRQLQRLGGRIVVMHGHRHIDWIGQCGTVRIVSAPSPVMESTGQETTYFHIHTLGLDETGRFGLLKPERIDVPGTAMPG
jgi:predicted MPP superfamily phosphohydrolase